MILFQTKRRLPISNSQVLSSSHLGVCNVAPSGRNDLVISIAFRFSRDTRLIVCTMANAISIKGRDKMQSLRHASLLTLGTLQLQGTTAAGCATRYVGREKTERKLRCNKYRMRNSVRFYLCLFYEGCSPLFKLFLGLFRVLWKSCENRFQRRPVFPHRLS